jgi:perosamine synthetase
MTWPSYSAACRNSIQGLLMQGGSLSAYRANKAYGAEPKLGSWAQRLESQLAMRVGVKYAVAVNSGTAALHAGLSALDLRGGEVVTSPYTFSATASAIVLAGCVPVFADVDPQTFCITKETVKRVITRRTKAILPVDLFGGCAPIRSLRELGLPIIEDGCQAVGSTSMGVHVSQSIGVSFNGGKNIAAGECGALLTNSPRVENEARLLMNHAENFGVDQIGYNYRPNELTACVAYHGLMELGANNRERINLAEALTSLIRGEPKLRKYIEIPESVKFDGSHVFYVYPFKIKNMSRKLFATRMKNRFGITVGEGYINPCLHEYKAFRKYAKGRLPVVEKLSRESLCLFYDVTPGASIKDMENKVAAMVQCATSRDRK